MLLWKVPNHCILKTLTSMWKLFGHICFVGKFFFPDFQVTTILGRSHDWNRKKLSLCTSDYREGWITVLCPIWKKVRSLYVQGFFLLMHGLGVRKKSEFFKCSSDVHPNTFHQSSCTHTGKQSLTKCHPQTSLTNNTRSVKSLPLKQQFIVAGHLAQESKLQTPNSGNTTSIDPLPFVTNFPLPPPPPLRSI